MVVCNVNHAAAFLGSCICDLNFSGRHTDRGRTAREDQILVQREDTWTIDWKRGVWLETGDLGTRVGRQIGADTLPTEKVTQQHGLHEAVSGKKDRC